MNVKRLSLSCVLLICLFLSQVSSGFEQPLFATEVSDVPFIYYHSSDDNAFVIERADGSDSRYLTAFTLPSEHFIVGPGWSPSGNYFAWMTRQYDVSSSIFVIDRYGNSISPQIQSEYIFNAVWFQTGSILLIDHVPLGTRYREFVVFDAETQHLIVASRDDALGLNTAGLLAAPDGSHIVAFYSAFGADSRSRTLQVISKDGQVTTRTAYHSACNTILPVWSPQGSLTYVHPSENMLIIENIYDGELEYITIPNQEVALVDWNATGDYALVFLANGCSTSQTTFELWLLGLNDQSINLLVQDTARLFPPQPQHIYSRSVPYPKTAWRPQGDMAAIHMSEGLSLFIVPERRMQHIATTQQAFIEPFWWTNDGRQIVFSNHEYLYVHDVDSHTTAQYASLSNYGIDYISPLHNDTYVGYTSAGYGYMLNITTGTQHQMELINGVYPDSDIIGMAQVYWNPTQNWLFAFSDAGFNYRVVNIMSADGMLHREIGGCTLSPACFGWMPDHDR